MSRGRSKRRIVVTAGPTHEHVDPVRFLGNESSGKMGFEVARAAARLGDSVILIAGPVHQPTPKGVERVDVVSAREMLAAAREAFRDADALVMAAAVADWRPRRRRSGKWREKDAGGDSTTLDLVKNPDILATLARRKAGRLVIGFALETGGTGGSGRARALAKMRRKNADYIVLNDETALRADRSSVLILGRDGSEVRLDDCSKRTIAGRLVRLECPNRSDGVHR